PFYTQLDHYYRLHEAREHRGWLVDYTHLTNPRVQCPQKEISQESLVRRFEKVLEVGGDKVWTANGDEVVDYILVHRSTLIQEVAAGLYDWEWELRAETPQQVQRRLLTFSFEIPPEKSGIRPTIKTEPTQVLAHEEVQEEKYLFSINV